MLTYEEFRSSTDADVSDENVRDTFTPSDGYAYGLELFGQKMVGKLTGWIAYTYSVSRKIMDSQYSNGEEEYYTNWDRAHALSILGSYVKNDKWDINMTVKQIITATNHRSIVNAFTFQSPYTKIIVDWWEENKKHDQWCKLFIKRNIVFERLRILSRLFSKDRLDMIQHALEEEK